MRSTYRVALAAFAVALALGAVSASAAFAAPEWYTAAKGPEWAQGGVALTAAIPVKAKGKVTITDAKEGATVECEASGEGTVGAGGTGSQTSLALTKCKLTVAGNCSSLQEAGGTDGLPWSSTLSEYRERWARENFSPGSGSLGFNFTCTLAGAKVEDKCTASTSTGTATNTTTGVEVGLSGAGTCSASGGKSTLTGTLQVEATKGAKLELKYATFTKLTAPLAVEGTVTNLVVEDGEFVAGVKCSATFRGELEPNGYGKISNFSPSGCTTSGACEVQTLEGLDVGLPWKSGLEGSESIREVLSSGGSGTPEYEFKCKASGIGYTYSCSFTPAMHMENYKEGSVLGEWNYTSTTCFPGRGAKGRLNGQWRYLPPTGVAAIAVKQSGS